jgi:hypothetical protein
MQDARLFAIVGVSIIVVLQTGGPVSFRRPGAEVNQLASLGTEWPEAV